MRGKLTNAVRPPLPITSPENTPNVDVTVLHTNLCLVYMCIVTCGVYCLGC